MASPAQVSTDLRLWAGKLNGRHHQGEMLDPLCRSLIRAANLLSEQQARIDMLEGELDRFRQERAYVVGFNDGFAKAEGTP